MAASGFGRRVRQARLQLAARMGEEVSQSELARLLDVQPSTVQRWEAGAKQPSFETVEHLARVLGVSPAYLAFGIVEGELKEVPPGTPNAVPVIRTERPAIPASDALAREQTRGKDGGKKRA